MTTLPEDAAGARTDADLIREQLSALGLSQREAARQLGVEDRAMRYYCAGKLAVPAAVMLALEQLRAAATLVVVHPALEAAYQAADASPQPLDELELAGRLEQAIAGLGRDLEPLERRGAFAVVGALNFMSGRMYSRPVWDMHWQPQRSWTDEQSLPRHIPDLNGIDDDIVREWSRRARAARHLVLRARYADLAWEIARFRKAAALRNSQTRDPMQPDPEDARLAIEAYLKAVARHLAVDVFRGWRYLGRAVELAASLRDDELLRRAKDAIFAYRATCEGDDPTYPLWLFDDIAWEQRRALGLSDGEKAIAIGALERMLALRSEAFNTQLFEPHSAQDAADRLGRWLRELRQEAEARRAANIAGLAMETAAEKVPALSGIGLLQRLAERYRNAGEKVSVARVEEAIRRLAPAAKGELRHVEVPFDLPKDKLDAWADHVAGATFAEGIERVAGMNLIRKDQVEATVLEFAESGHWFVARMPIQLIREDGFSSAVIGSTEEDLEGRAIHYAARLIGGTAPFLNIALSRFREKHGVDLKTLSSWLAKSPLFPDSRLKLTHDGLAAWFSEDWVKAVHVLLPQVEAALRDLLAKLGGAVMKPDPHHGGFQSIGLGEILSAETFVAQVAEDIRFHLRVLLTDPRGINLRNDALHGLAAHELFGRGIANWLVHAVIMIGLFRLQPVASAANAAK